MRSLNLVAIDFSNQTVKAANSWGGGDIERVVSSGEIIKQRRKYLM